MTEPECKSPTTYFWYHTTLEASPSMDESGGLKWWIVLCLFAAWAIVFLIVMKGIQSSGNVNIAFALSLILLICLFVYPIDSAIIWICFLGCILYITLSIRGAHHIFHTWHNVEGCRSRLSAHVHAGYGKAAKADGVAGCCDASVLFVWIGFRVVDCLRQLQHAKK